MVGLATYNVWTVSSSIAKKEGLPLVNQLISWVILGKVNNKKSFGN